MENENVIAQTTEQEVKDIAPEIIEVASKHNGKVIAIVCTGVLAVAGGGVALYRFLKKKLIDKKNATSDCCDESEMETETAED